MTEYASCGMMVEMQETEAANISWKKEEIRQVRRSADLIGIVEIASILINLLLYPIVRLLPVLEEGSLGAEVYDLLLYLIVFAIPVTGYPSSKSIKKPDKPPTTAPALDPR